MFARKNIMLSVILVAILSVPAFAANPWIAITNPEPFTVWDARTSSMAPSDQPLDVWQTDRKQMVVWDFVNVSGNVQIDLMKDGKVFKTLSPEGGTAVGNDGKGSLTVRMSPDWVSTTHYQIRVSSLVMPDISSISKPFSIVLRQ